MVIIPYMIFQLFFLLLKGSSCITHNQVLNTKEKSYKDFHECKYSTQDNFYFHDEPILNQNNIATLINILHNNKFKFSKFTY